MTKESSPKLILGDISPVFPYPFGGAGFDPYNNLGDRWLYNEARGDSRLLFALLAKDEQQRMALQRETPSDQQERIDALHKEIRIRQDET